MRYERIHSIIEEHNADPTSTYKMGHNEFSVLDVEELIIANIHACNQLKTSLVDLEAVPPLQPLRSWNLYSVTRQERREQQVVDCDFADRHQCGGGSYHEYWRSLITAGGQALSTCYPYVSGGTRVRGHTWKKMENGAKHADASNPIIALKSRDELEVMKLLLPKRFLTVSQFNGGRSGVSPAAIPHEP
uniref:Peptidase C1A papain C-terminal domain-containing protein n=1 Tax=Daphnia galeata TaxID=27404 RepID=A0A8J2RJW2_9CRUS|nr:unnamed protein product [Daphnia galeata]